ncbi:MAG: phosphotransferase [Chloroflexota bacterium]|nr:phosphotransferase [Chloroflexota bacterium]
MTSELEEDALQRVVRRLDPGGTLRRAWPLAGGVSAEVTALEVEGSDGRPTTLVVRRYGNTDRGRNPHIARDEFRLLQIAQSHGLAAPTPYVFDESGELFPTPSLVIEFVEGETEFAPPDLAGYLAQAAAQLAKIHRVNDRPELSFLPRRDRGVGEPPADLDASLNEARIRDALESAWPLSGVNPSVLLHGDYWPGNILWKDGELAAVVHWEDAGVGDPLADLANARLEMLWAFGVDAMYEFTDQYRSLTTVNMSNLPYWDLWAALRPSSTISGWGLDAATEQRMSERHQLFVSRALDELPSG